MNESSLVIRGVRLQHEGSYQCTASNPFGRDVESLSLTIAGNVTGYGTKQDTRYILYLAILVKQNCKLIIMPIKTYESYAS